MTKFDQPTNQRSVQFSINHSTILILEGEGPDVYNCDWVNMYVEESRFHTILDQHENSREFKANILLVQLLLKCFYR